MPINCKPREPDRSAHEFVLVAGSRATVWHIPDPFRDRDRGTGPERPFCGGKTTARGYQRRDPATLPDRFRPCMFCHGQVSGDRATYRREASKLQRMDPEDVGL